MAVYAVDQPTRWREMPTGPVRLHPRWRGRGLQAFYLMRDQSYGVNLVTGQSGISSTFGTGVTRLGDRIRTSGDNTNGVRWSTGYDLRAERAGTVLVGFRFISSASNRIIVCLLRTDVSVSTGLYLNDAASGGSFVHANNDTYDGVATSTTGLDASRMSFVASSFGATSDLRAAFGQEVALDSAFTAWAAGTLTTVTFGMWDKLAKTLPCLCEIAYFGVANQQWSDAELRAINAAPYGELLQAVDRRVYVSVAAASGFFARYYYDHSAMSASV